MSRPNKPVAIIGSSFRLPTTDNKTFTECLLDNADLITRVDPSRWNLDAFLHPDQKFPGTSYTFASGTLGNINGFDAAFFGLSPREVVHMDPQQRFLLEMSWEAMEHAGYAPSSLRGSNCAVYMGVASFDYGLRYIDDYEAIDQNTGTGTTASIAANRISYLFDLKGPSLVIDTACSSSLVAFHHACESIRRGEVSLALAGGISLHFHPLGFLTFSKASMLSRQGRCRVFDASADGYVRSEGGGVLLLKDYELAVEAGDNILAVVAASAANADGYKSALTIPKRQCSNGIDEAGLRSSGYLC
ncbi:MAG: polyketide synthase [Nitrincola sp.]|nr:polyketide synthase [Nitrincola sp.]